MTPINCITPEEDERFYLEPLDPSSEVTLANARATETLSDLGRFVEQEEMTLRTGRPGRQREHKVYDITSLPGETIARAIAHSMEKTLPCTVWVRRGQAVPVRFENSQAYVRYFGEKRKIRLKKPQMGDLLASGVVRKAG